MIKLIYSLLILSCLSSCVTNTLKYTIDDQRDPFTRMRRRSMYIVRNDNSQLMDLLYATSANPYRAKPVPVPVNHVLTLVAEDGDTMLTYVRFRPEVAYDIPADSKMQLLLIAKDQTRRVVILNLIKPYHTIGGAVIASGRIERGMPQVLAESPIHGVRIDKVSTNQADLEAVDYYPDMEYREVFQKGIAQFFNISLETKPAAPAKPKKPKKLYYYK